MVITGSDTTTTVIIISDLMSIVKLPTIIPVPVLHELPERYNLELLEHCNISDEVPHTVVVVPFGSSKFDP